MKNALFRFISCFILNKEKRKKFRSRHLRKTAGQLILDACARIEYSSERQRLLNEQNLNSARRIQHSVEQLEREHHKMFDFMHRLTDVSKVPPAQGSMRMIQECSVCILSRFAELAKKHHIKWWIDSGTLIGYLRHNGFIPWDDDIDIAMMREDYEKICPILAEEFSADGFHFAHSEILRLFYKNTPGQVDVFPIDRGYQEAPPDGEAYTQFVSRLDGIKSSIAYQWEKLYMQVPVVTREEVENALKQRDLHIPSVPRGFLYYGVETCVKNRCAYEDSDVFPLQPATFLGIETYIPNNAPYWLYSQYGDYMTIPKGGFELHDDIVSRLSVRNFKECQHLIANHLPQRTQERNRAGLLS